eukprot:Skav219295  [mRNA]  locus=scaffold2157:432557:451800:+ [translate_table: standard]
MKVSWSFRVIQFPVWPVVSSQEQEAPSSIKNQYMDRKALYDAVHHWSWRHRDNWISIEEAEPGWFQVFQRRAKHPRSAELPKPKLQALHCQEVNTEFPFPCSQQSCKEYHDNLHGFCRKHRFNHMSRKAYALLMKGLQWLELTILLSIQAAAEIQSRVLLVIILLSLLPVTCIFLEEKTGISAAAVCVTMLLVAVGTCLMTAKRLDAMQQAIFNTGLATEAKYFQVLQPLEDLEEHSKHLVQVSTILNRHSDDTFQEVPHTKESLKEEYIEARRHATLFQSLVCDPLACVSSEVFATIKPVAELDEKEALGILHCEVWCDSLQQVQHAWEVLLGLDVEIVVAQDFFAVASSRKCVRIVVSIQGYFATVFLLETSLSSLQTETGVLDVANSLGLLDKTQAESWETAQFQGDYEIPRCVLVATAFLRLVAFCLSVIVGIAIYFLHIQSHWDYGEDRWSYLREELLSLLTFARALPFWTCAAILLWEMRCCCCCLCWKRRRMRARPRPTQVWYRKYFGIQGRHYAFKVVALQLITVVIQGVAKASLFATIQATRGSEHLRSSTAVHCFVGLLICNIIFPALVFLVPNAVFSRFLAALMDAVLDFGYIITSVWLYILFATPENLEDIFVKDFFKKTGISAAAVCVTMLLVAVGTCLMTAKRLDAMQQAIFSTGLATEANYFQVLQPLEDLEEHSKHLVQVSTILNRHSDDTFQEVPQAKKGLKEKYIEARRHATLFQSLVCDPLACVSSEVFATIKPVAELDEKEAVDILHCEVWCDSLQQVQHAWEVLQGLHVEIVVAQDFFAVASSRKCVRIVVSLQGSFATVFLLETSLSSLQTETGVLDVANSLGLLDKTQAESWETAQFQGDYEIPRCVLVATAFLRLVAFCLSVIVAILIHTLPLLSYSQQVYLHGEDPLLLREEVSNSCARALPFWTCVGILLWEMRCCCCCCVCWKRRRMRARPRPTQVWYRKYFGIQGRHYAFKVVALQLITVMIQGVAKASLFATIQATRGSEHLRSSTAVHCFVGLLICNIIFPALVFLVPNAVFSRFLAALMDAVLDFGYIITSVWLYILFATPENLEDIFVKDFFNYAALYMCTVHVLCVCRSLETADWAALLQVPHAQPIWGVWKRALFSTMYACSLMVFVGLLLGGSFMGSKDAGLCPPCECSGNGSGSVLLRRCFIPTGFVAKAASPIEFNLTNKNITEVLPDAFLASGVHRPIDFLSLRGNHLTALPEGWWDSDRILDLSGNKLQELPPQFVLVLGGHLDQHSAMGPWNGTPKYDLHRVAEACHQGDLDVLDMLLFTGDSENKFPGDINTHVQFQGKTVMTPLMLACQTGQIECVQLMIKAKADPHMKCRVCLNGPEEKLEETSVCQPAMFLAGMAGLEKLRDSRPEAVEQPGAVAGLSLGEYTALCAAGVFTFEQGMELVKVRGAAMAEAAKSRPQAMLSVAGLEQCLACRAVQGFKLPKLPLGRALQAASQLSFCVIV